MKSYRNYEAQKELIEEEKKDREDLGLGEDCQIIYVKSTAGSVLFNILKFFGCMLFLLTMSGGIIYLVLSFK